MSTFRKQSFNLKMLFHILVYYFWTNQGSVFWSFSYFPRLLLISKLSLGFSQEPSTRIISTDPQLMHRFWFFDCHTPMKSFWTKRINPRYPRLDCVCHAFQRAGLCAACKRDGFFLLPDDFWERLRVRNWQLEKSVSILHELWKLVSTKNPLWLSNPSIS